MSPAAATAVAVLALALVNVGVGLNSDGLALLSFKYAVVSDPLGVLESWDYNDSSPCGWTGVVCAAVRGDSQPRVVGLVMPGSQLQGSISDQLGSLQHLRHIDLSRNLLNGPLPPSLSNATELRMLSLSSNGFSSVVPSSLGSLPKLQHVNLSDNAFIGDIPVELTTAPALRFLSLSRNNFSGEVPAGFGTNAQPLEALDLSLNQLSGSLPSEIGTVHYLNLSSNRLSGPIPPELGRSIPMNATLDLAYNNFSGPVPQIGAFPNQEPQSFFGNPGLCGSPLNILCSVPTNAPNPANVSNQANAGTSPPAIAAIPETLPQQQQPTGGGSGRAEGQAKGSPHRSGGGLSPMKIAGAMVGGLALLSLASMLFIYGYQARRKEVQTSGPMANMPGDEKKKNPMENRGRWCCARAGGRWSGNEDDESASESTSSVSESEDEPGDQKPGHLVAVDGETTELEMERLLKASAYILGSSGTGIVYKAVLDDGTALAVRRIGSSSPYRMSDFENRIRVISKLRHANLARLRAFYLSPDEKLLIYDYAPNGSLAAFFHSSKSSYPSPSALWSLPTIVLPLLQEERISCTKKSFPSATTNFLFFKSFQSSCSCRFSVSLRKKTNGCLLVYQENWWDARLRVARGMARGLAYLHDKKYPHGNVKPSNVLLGPNMDPWIGDFGLDGLVRAEASIGSGSSAYFNSSRRSTLSQESLPHACRAGSLRSGASANHASHYQAPEAHQTLRPTRKWDVYSFGVLFLELITGRPVTEADVRLWEHGARAEDRNRALKMVDPGIRSELEVKEEGLLVCLRLGFACASSAPQRRPAMKEVVQVLERIPASSSFLPSSPYY
ncbi:Receptor kinase-like protein [Nymphaea thermarum]|nr:Receptor kinase-like protein [Nymphaea thermarum]